jgi:hypothetical protein
MDASAPTSACSAPAAYGGLVSIHCCNMRDFFTWRFTVTIVS